MIHFLQEKNSWYICRNSTVLAICTMAGNLPLITFTKEASNLLPSLITLIAKGTELLKTKEDCGEACSLDFFYENQLIKICKQFALKYDSNGSIKIKGFKPLSEEDYWKSV